MSVAIRKRSWEEHVTQWMGQPFNSDDYNIACHHGLVADSLKASMEKDATPNVDRKERCVSQSVAERYGLVPASKYQQPI